MSGESAASAAFRSFSPCGEGPRPDRLPVFSKFSDIPMSGESAASAATTHTFFFLFGKEEEKYGAKKEGKTQLLFSFPFAENGYKSAREKITATSLF
jgi:hypothetical protein